jgi:tetratricopeptide (TPR) repeat protein
MLNFFRNILPFIILLLANKAFALNSSAYLISNTAVNFFDFDQALEEFGHFENNLSENDLHNQLITYVNLNLISKADDVAKKIISINNLNQEAWIVSLTNDVINKKLKKINLHKSELLKSEMNILKYIFFNNNGNIKENKLIANSIYEVIQASISKNNDSINYEFFLFYLSIATIIDPTFNEAYFYLAKIYQILKNYNKAEFFYSKITKDHHLFIESKKNIAINKSEVGLHGEGINLLEDIQTNNQNDFELKIAFADVYRFQKNYVNAIKYYTEIINVNNQLYDSYWRIFYLRGICFEKLNKWDEAEKDFLYSLKIKPDSPEVLNYLAYGWLERDLYFDKAMKMLLEAYEANPDSYYIADSLAWAYYKKNDLINAVNLMEKVISMVPGEVISLDHLGDIYFAMTRKREAVFFWKQALDLANPDDKISQKIIKKLKLNNAG